MSDTDPPAEAASAEHPGLLNRLGHLFHAESEGDAPRPVDTSPPPLETHNRVAVDEPYPASGMEGNPTTPAYGTTDESAVPELAQAEAPRPPLGPDPVSGGMMTDVPTPHVPQGDLSPTDSPSGMFGGAEEGGQKMNGPGERDE